MTRYLTKSLFKLGVTCPTKLFYAAHNDVYANARTEDTFLQALAEGGMQVGALAKLMHPDGIEITARGHDAQVDETAGLLARDNVTLFEAAIRYEGFFARVDVLRKRGDAVDIVEVKSKSFDPGKADSFEAKNGAPKSDWLPYLQDLAFQCHVFSLAFPNLSVRGRLLLVDKSKVATVDGLAARFRVHRESGRARIVLAPGTDRASIGDPILTEADVHHLVREIVSGRLKLPGQEGAWDDRVRWLGDVCTSRSRVDPTIGAHCKGCEFRATAGDGKLSGFDECWARPLNGPQGEDLSAGTVLDLWNSRDAQSLIDRRILRLVDTAPDAIGATGQTNPLTTPARRWLQVTAAQNGTREKTFLGDHVLREMAGWTFPLHFIDFETARSPIPFRQGQRPNALVAFQFSHHVMEADGSISHRTEFLDVLPGSDPTIPFVRALREALGDHGTVFMWSHHERSVLTELVKALDSDREAVELAAFIGTLLEGGPRALYDLCKLSEEAFFHPATGGSSSIKKVLRAVLDSSRWLSERYGKPVYGAPGGIISRNFTNKTWFKRESGGVVDPYTLLPPVIAGATPEEIDELESRHIAEGAAAAAAYVRLQDTTLEQGERVMIEDALRRYCELDTLAMVMIVEAWRDWCGISARTDATG